MFLSDSLHRTRITVSSNYSKYSNVMGWGGGVTVLSDS